jgi:hypothetical protein
VSQSLSNLRLTRIPKLEWVAWATRPSRWATGPTEWETPHSVQTALFYPQPSPIPRGRLPRGTGKLPVPPFFGIQPTSEFGFNEVRLRGRLPAPWRRLVRAPQTHLSTINHPLSTSSCCQRTPQLYHVPAPRHVPGEYKMRFPITFFTTPELRRRKMNRWTGIVPSFRGRWFERGGGRNRRRKLYRSEPNTLCFKR